MSKFSLPSTRTRQLPLEHNSGPSQLSVRSLLTARHVPVQLESSLLLHEKLLRVGIKLLRWLIPSIIPGTNEDLGRIVERRTECCDIISLKHGLHEKINMGKDSLKLKNAVLYTQPQNFVFYLSYSKLSVNISASMLYIYT